MQPVFEQNSLDKLIEYLNANNNESFKNDLKLNRNDFKKFEHWNRECYTRNCIVRSDKYELLLLCWEEGQKTAIHNHDQQECWVYMISGNIKEEMYNIIDGKPFKVNESTLEEGEVSYINDSLGYHNLSNITEGRTVSLHLYAKPIQKSNVFDMKTKSFSLKKAKDFSKGGIKL